MPQKWMLLWKSGYNTSWYSHPQYLYRKTPMPRHLIQREWGVGFYL